MPNACHAPAASAHADHPCLIAAAASLARDEARSRFGGDAGAMRTQLDKLSGAGASGDEAGIREREALLDLIAQDRLAAGGATDWPFLLDASEGGVVKLRALGDALQAIGLWPGDELPETRQNAASLMLTRGDPDSLSRTLAGIRTLSPHCIPFGDGYVRFPVFDRTLGAGPARALLLDPARPSIALVEGPGGERIAFDGLEAAVSHVQEHHWYDAAR